MPEYIDREKAVDALLTEMCMTGYQSRAINVIRMIEKEDVAPVVHAKWIKPVFGDGENHCSACKAEQPWFFGYGYYEPDFCPNCGAKMDGYGANAATSEATDSDKAVS